MRSNLLKPLILNSLILLLSTSPATAEEEFAPLFNGKDFSGWEGRPMVDPVKWQAMSSKEKEPLVKKYNADMKKHWKVEDGEIVSDGKGVYLTTEKNYGDFDLHLEWKMVRPATDSGIYLRGYPQIQIWDPKNKEQFKHGNQKGSGGLWNNNDEKNGKFPLVIADKPIGEWNKFEISMRGERVTIRLNGKLVVDNATLENYFARKKPIVASGPIQLQTHGDEMRFRNLVIKELPSSKKTK